MAANPYEVLGVKPDASQDDIRTAYRKLAKRLHPDLNPGDAQATEKFKSVSAAYGLIGDPDKRARFDRGDIDATGAERPAGGYYRDFQTGPAQDHPYRTRAGFADFEDVLSDLFAAQEAGRHRMRGRDLAYALEVDFVDAVNGATRRITLPDGSALDVAIPPGTGDGQVLRLRGKGTAGSNGGGPGDALVTVSVRPHPLFSRRGDDIDIELPITLREAVLGAKLEVPTPTGRVAVTVPRASSSGRKLRLRGQGVPRRDGTRGDEYVTLRIVLPEAPDPELEALVERWAAGREHDPRRHPEASS